MRFFGKKSRPADQTPERRATRAFASAPSVASAVPGRKGSAVILACLGDVRVRRPAT